MTARLLAQDRKLRRRLRKLGLRFRRGDQVLTGVPLYASDGTKKTLGELDVVVVSATGRVKAIFEVKAGTAACTQAKAADQLAGAARLLAAPQRILTDPSALVPYGVGKAGCPPGRVVRPLAPVSPSSPVLYCAVHLTANCSRLAFVPLG